MLLDLLDEAFDKKSWHGPNLRGSIRGVTAKQAAGVRMADRHNIWELTLHAAYWKYVVRRQLSGQKRGSFVLPEATSLYGRSKTRNRRGRPMLRFSWPNTVNCAQSCHKLQTQPRASAHDPGRRRARPVSCRPNWVVAAAFPTLAGRHVKGSKQFI